jgi:hypothetical protein
MKRSEPRLARRPACACSFAPVAMTISLAVRNLLRNRRRSLATLLALAIGAASVLLFGGFIADIRLGMVTGYVRERRPLPDPAQGLLPLRQRQPHRLRHPGYERIADAIRRDPQLKDAVKVVSPMLQFGGVAGNYDAGVSRAVVGLGFVADDVSRMREWNEYALPTTRRPTGCRARRGRRRRRHRRGARAAAVRAAAGAQLPEADRSIGGGGARRCPTTSPRSPPASASQANAPPARASNCSPARPVGRRTWPP